MEKKTWTKEEILALLERGGAKAEITYRALQAIYKRQTSDEQQADTTKHHNKVGFNGPDAYILSRIAKNSLSYGHLTVRQNNFVLTRIKKYAGQLVAIANGG
jgi:hypothetical protein